MTSTTEQPGPAPSVNAEQKPAKKPNVGKRAGYLASNSVKPGKKAGPTRKAQKGRTKAKVTKTAKTSTAKTSTTQTAAKSAGDRGRRLCRRRG